MTLWRRPPVPTGLYVRNKLALLKPMVILRLCHSGYIYILIQASGRIYRGNVCTEFQRLSRSSSPGGLKNLGSHSKTLWGGLYLSAAARYNWGMEGGELDRLWVHFSQVFLCRQFLERRDLVLSWQRPLPNLPWKSV